VRPGITDFASIVFADEGEILKSSSNPDLRYNQVIRPWKSRLGLFYARHHSFWVDTWVIVLTLAALFSRRHALSGLQSLLSRLGAEPRLVEIAGRTSELTPCPPPGASEVEIRF
jgi:hypothetical protein